MTAEQLALFGFSIGAALSVLGLVLLSRSRRAPAAAIPPIETLAFLAAFLTTAVGLILGRRALVGVAVVASTWEYLLIGYCLAQVPLLVALFRSERVECRGNLVELCPAALAVPWLATVVVGVAVAATSWARVGLLPIHGVTITAGVTAIAFATIQYRASAH